MTQSEKTEEAAVPGTADLDSQATIDKDLTDSLESSLQTSLQTNLENGLKQTESLPPELIEIIATWTALPDNIKQAIRTLIRPFMEEDRDG